jgi:beta-glucosidase-like glycosyl hydrolase
MSTGTVIQLRSSHSCSQSLVPAGEKSLSFDLQPWGHWGLDKINTTAGIALAVDAARQSFVLLKNEKSTLPLRQGVKLAVLGPHAH